MMMQQQQQFMKAMQEQNKPSGVKGLEGFKLETFDPSGVTEEEEKIDMASRMLKGAANQWWVVEALSPQPNANRDRIISSAGTVGSMGRRWFARSMARSTTVVGRAHRRITPNNNGALRPGSLS